MFKAGKIYTGKVENQTFRFKAISQTPDGNFYFEDVDDFFWYLNTAMNPLVILGTVAAGKALLVDYKGYGIELYA